MPESTRRKQRVPTPRPSRPRARPAEAASAPGAEPAPRASALAAAPSEPTAEEREAQLQHALADLGRRRAWGQLTLAEFEAKRTELLGPRPVVPLADRRVQPAAASAAVAIAPSPPAPAAKHRDMPDEHWDKWGAARDGARIVLTRPQWFTLAMVILVGQVFLILRPHLVLMIWIDIVTALYLATGAYKIWLLVRGEMATSRFVAPPPAKTEDLPTYTILVPLHREGRILPVLVERLKMLDYPVDRLQILLLIERDDEETKSAVAEYALPKHIRSMTMPEGQPRTKPRALNIGLHFADGEFIVIYDAEDRPEPDQLRKAVSAFRNQPADVICVQARLNFYNRYQSMLTRLFSIDYAIWYDQLLPGLTTSGMARSSAFVPLGGTSNHFRVDKLRELGGWDPYNVTEDCDLGVRLGRQGLRVGLLDSVTWEEAVPNVRPWIKQRSRWVKGYMQTFLVHMRRPRLLWRQLGARGFLDFQMLVGGSSLILLLNPIMWALTALYVVSRGNSIGGFIESLFPTTLYYLALLSLVVGNFVLFYTYAYVCVRRSYVELTRFTLLAPVYWVLMSIGAWVGLLSLIRNPFYWAKTEHGVSLAGTSTRSFKVVGAQPTSPARTEVEEAAS